MPKPSKSHRSLFSGWGGAGRCGLCTAAFASCLAGLVLPDAVQASASATDKPDEPQVVEVTAQRQRQDLRQVPFALSVWDGRTAQARPVESLESLAGLVPATSIAAVPGSALVATIGVRGLSSGQPGLWADPTVAVYVDGVFLGKSVGMLIDVADVLRVESLRGPQGTLYGRNAAAGAINFITRAPSGVAGGTVRASLGDGRGRDLRASLDLPAAGPVAASVWLRRQRQDGSIEGPASAPWGTRDRQAARVAMAGRADGRFEWRVHADHAEVEELPTIGWLRSASGYASAFPSASPVGALARAFAAGPGRELEPWVQSGWPSRVVSGNELGLPSQRARVAGQSLHADWRLDDGSVLRWIAARRSVSEGVTQELDGSPRFVLGVDRDSSYRLQSHELHWTGSRPGWRHLFGLYAFRDHGRSVLRQGGEALSFLPGQPAWQRNAFEVDTTAWAAFGQVDVERDGLGLGIGARYTRETRGVRVERFATDAGFVEVLPPGVLRREARATFSAVTPVLQIGAELPDGRRAYARYAKGFRSGAFPAEAPVTATSGPDTAFRPERTASIDAGLKGGGPASRWSLGFFRMDVRDLHASALPPGTIAPTIVNAGHLVSRGLEAEVAASLRGDAKVSASYGYLDARFRSFRVPSAFGDLVEAGPRTVPAAAPRHTLSLALEGPRTRLGERLELKAALELRHMASRYGIIAQRDGPDPANAAVGPRAADARLPALTLVDLQATLAHIAADGGSRTELAVELRNALDQRRRIGFIDVGGLYQLAYGSEPRRLGITLTQSW